MMAQQTGAGPGRRPRAGRRPVLLFFVLVAVVVAIAIAAGWLPRISRQKALLAASEQVTEQKPVVIATAAHLEASNDAIDLPGDLQAMIESPIFSRADGYLKTRLVDIGSHVKAGQLMAEIETPELDQQISQARATLAQAQSSQKELQADIALAKANLDLARITSERWQRLLAKGVVSAAGSGPAKCRPGGKAGADRAGPGEPRDRAGHNPGQPGESQPPGRVEGLLARHGAVRRSGDGAQRGYRHADQRREARRCSAWRGSIRCGFSCRCRKPT